MAEASTGRTGPGFSSIDLLLLLIITASKFSHAFPVVGTFAHITNIHVKEGGSELIGSRPPW
eukprot:727007-Pelagomonas_calceolata.AAC.1